MIGAGWILALTAVFLFAPLVLCALLILDGRRETIAVRNQDPKRHEAKG